MPLGWPDLTVLGPAGILFRELKQEGGRLTPEQREVGWIMRSVGLSWKVWRPSCLDDGSIDKELESVTAAS